MPSWEIDNLVNAINEVRKEEERHMRLSSSAGQIGFK